MANTCEALEAAVVLTMTHDLIGNPATYLRSINYSKSFSWAPFSFDFLCSKVNLSFLLPRKFQALLKIPHRANVFSHWYKFQLQMVRQVSLEGVFSDWYSVTKFSLWLRMLEKKLSCQFVLRSMDTGEHNGGKVKDQELQNQTIPFSKNGGESLTRNSPKEVSCDQRTHEKILSSLNIREMQLETMRLLSHA